MLGNKLIKLILILLPFYCFSQNNEKAPLVDVLTEIAEQHNIKFSYIDEELKVYTIVPPAKALHLKDKLSYIENRTRLKFEAVTSSYYTVYNDIRMDKPLCGYIIDIQTGEGVENAQVEISGTSISVASGPNGYFSLPTLAPNTIYIKHLGYATISINPQDLYVPDCPVITIQPVTAQLQEMMTERYLAAGISKSRSGEITLRPKSFGILPGLTEADVLQTMQQLPGVTSVDETVANINVRGGTHDQNLFLWNGVRIYQTSHFFGLLSAFNPLSPSKIAIYKNGTPVFFGESVSSLVNISTRTALPDSTYTIASADMLNISFLSMIKTSKSSMLQISGRRSYADVIETPTFRDYKKRIFQNTTVTDVIEALNIPVQSNEDFNFYDLSLHYRQDIDEKHELFVSGIGVQNSIHIQQATTLASRTGDLEQKNFGGNISFNSKWKNNHLTEFEGTVSWYDLTGTNEAIENEQATRQRNSVLDISFLSKYTYSGFHNLHLSTGYQINEVGVTNVDEVNLPAFSRKNKEVSVSHAVVGEAKYTFPNEQTNITSGIRLNYFEKFNLYLPEPRIALNHYLNSVFNIELAAEQKSQTLSQIVDLQQDFLGIEKRRWVLANDNDIPVQKSSQASLGITYTYNGWMASAEGFYKKVSGITSDSQAFQNQFEFASATGEYIVTGTEVLLQKSFDRFYSWISYTYTDNNYTFNGFLPPDFANNFTISHSVGFAGIYEQDNFKIALGAKWRTGKPITDPAGFIINTNNPAESSIIYQSPNSSRTDDIVQVNFSANKKWNFKSGWRLTAGCSILNVLDRQNVINRYYRINRNNNSVESVDTYALGRTPNISLKAEF